MQLIYIKKHNDGYDNLNQILKDQFKLSTRLITKLKKNKMISINNNSIYKCEGLKDGDTVTVFICFEENSSNIVPVKMNLDILYEDEGLLIVNKPSNMAVHPSCLHYDDTLSNGVKYYFNSIGLKRLIRPINRLDRNTSGIVIFAKNQYIQELLSRQMQQEIFKKYYIAICNGIFEQKSGTLTFPIKRKEGSIIERCVCDNGESAITNYKVIKEFSNMSELLIDLETGRTHQIRVHMAHIGHFIIGDDLYGEKSNLINRQALHAYKVEFIHPISNKKIEIECSIPDDMLSILSLK